ncbi:hypothetical protein P7C70_g8881, partial [Phenoliferia sp. Uapishka_3]
MATSTANKTLNDRIMAKVGHLSVANAEEFFDAFKSVAQASGCWAYIITEVKAPEVITSTDYLNWEKATGNAAVLFAGYLGPNALALVHRDETPHVSWKRVIVNYTQENRLTGITALRALFECRLKSGAKAEEFFTEFGSTVRRVNMTLRSQLEAEEKRLLTLGTPKAKYTALGGVMQSLFILASIPQKYANVINSTLGKNPTLEATTAKLRLYCAEETIRDAPAQALAAATALAALTDVGAPTYGGRGRGSSGYGRRKGRGGGGGGGQARGGRDETVNLSANISNANAWPWGRNEKGQFRVGRNVCSKCFNEGHWAVASGTHPGCTLNARQQAQSKCSALAQFNINVNESQVQALVSVMELEPFQVFYPNDPAATQRAFNQIHTSLLAFTNGCNAGNLFTVATQEHTEPTDSFWDDVEFEDASVGVSEDGLFVEAEPVNCLLTTHHTLEYERARADGMPGLVVMDDEEDDESDKMSATEVDDKEPQWKNAEYTEDPAEPRASTGPMLVFRDGDVTIRHDQKDNLLPILRIP